MNRHLWLPEVSALGFEILREYLPIGLAWSIRSTQPLSLLLLISLLIWRGQTAKRWLRKPAMSWTAPTSPWKQSGNQEGISYLISGISQVIILRCRGRQEGFPVGPKRVPTTTRGTAENRAGRVFSETMYHSHACLFFHSQIVWLKEEVLSLVAIERRRLRKWNLTPHDWNDISSRNVTMLTFHSVTQNDRSRPSNLPPQYLEKETVIYMWLSGNVHILAL